MLQAQKKKVNIEQQQTKDIKRITTPFQTILKDNNESVLNALKKRQRIVSDVLLNISITECKNEKASLCELLLPSKDAVE